LNVICTSPFPYLYPLSSANVTCHSNAHIQDVLVVSYLANTIRTQIDLSNRLATAALTMGGGDPLAGDGKKDGDNRGKGGDRRGGGKGRQQREQEA
jgi:translation initiation factor 3 subunit F